MSVFFNFRYMLADTTKAIILKKPDNMTHEDAASLSIVVLTAYTGLVIHGQIDRSPKNVLIVGASGGIGVIAIQIAKKYNCKVTAICSGANEAFVKDYGADVVIDYKKASLDELFPYRNEYDVMLDCVGGDQYWELAQKVLKPEGIFTTAAGPLTDVSVSIGLAFKLISTVAWRKLAYARSYNMIMNPSAMPDPLKTWLENGSFKSIVTQRIKLQDAEKALEISRSHRTRGKIVIQISE